MNNKRSIIGNLVGLAVGDSIGLPFEGLSSSRKIKLFGKEIKQNLILNKGMFSDDTEHSCMVAESLILNFDNVDAFTKLLSEKFKIWLIGLPVGIGLSTLRSIFKLCIGYSYKSCGVFSAGNGPAMRSSIIGVFFNDELKKVKEFVRASTRLTHTDPKAEYGALVIALAAVTASKGDEIAPIDFLKFVEENLSSSATELNELLLKVIESVASGHTTSQFILTLGMKKGISGYIYHTVPAVIHCWLRNQSNYKSGIIEIIECGGDTDTTASILGGIIGARIGIEEIPSFWIKNIIDFPRTIEWIIKLSNRLADVKKNKCKDTENSLPFFKVLFRNLIFGFIVITHGFRRLLPPY